MGPFELVDLIGLDVNLEINESFWFQSYGEPRWKPSPLQARLVEAGRLGRKTGIGFHDYRHGPHRPPDPEPPPLGDGEGRTVAIGGDGVVAKALWDRAKRAGFDVRHWHDLAPPWLAVDARIGRRGVDERPCPRTILCASSDLAGCGEGRAAGFHLIGPLGDDVSLVETTTTSATDPEATQRADEFFAALGFLVERVGDAPGLVLGRIVAQLVNEAAFALEEGIAGPRDIDAGARLGLNYPRGPVEWSAAAGVGQIRAILKALGRWRGEERYRLSPLLRSGDPLDPSFHA
jgi:3-hydroxybutyryl-CoA dehydrogenase